MTMFLVGLAAGVALGGFSVLAALYVVRDRYHKHLSTTTAVLQAADLVERSRETRDSGRTTEVREKAGPAMLVDRGPRRPGSLARHRLQNEG